MPQWNGWGGWNSQGGWGPPSTVYNPQTVKIYQPLTGGTDGDLITVPLLEASDINDSDIALVWTKSTDGVWVSDSGMDTSIPAPVIVEGVEYDVSGAKSYRWQNKYQGKWFGLAIQDLFSSGLWFAQYTVGCYMKLDITETVTNGHDEITIQAGDGTDFAVLQAIRPGDDLILRVHTNAGTSSGLIITPNKRYWMTLMFDSPNGLARLAVYDPTNWSLVGTQELTLLTGKLASIVYLCRRDGHGDSPAVSEDSYSYVSQIMIKTDGTWPLLPFTS